MTRLQRLLFILLTTLAFFILLVGHVPFAQAQTDFRNPSILMYQGNDSNCDYIAVANGIHNIGGDGNWAYWKSRELVPQVGRDFQEVYYTLLGPQGSDHPFTVDNLGAAPEAFIGVYEALGYNAVFMASTPRQTDIDFVRAIRDRLIANPAGTFAHLWTMPGPYNPQARIFVVQETGEEVDFPYPYHEVAAIASPDPHSLVILDGLSGAPYTLRLEQIAYQLRGFNRVLVVSRNDSSLEDHQRFQLSQEYEPYVTARLGGAFLMTARQLWGNSYQQWGEVIDLPYRITDDESGVVAMLGRYVLYERAGNKQATLAPLGIWAAEQLVQAGMLSEEILSQETPAMSQGLQIWSEQTFGTVAQFEAIYGKPLTEEFGITAAQLRQVFPGVVPEEQEQYYICTLLERAMVAWDNTQGMFLVPIGQAYRDQMRGNLGVDLSIIPSNPNPALPPSPVQEPEIEPQPLSEPTQVPIEATASIVPEETLEETPAPISTVTPVPTRQLLPLLPIPLFGR